MKSKILTSVAGIVAIAAGLWVYQNNQVQRESILISANVPLSGDLAVYGEYIRDGATLAYSELKDQYPKVPEIKFDWQDNRGDLKDTVSIYQRQELHAPDLYISALKPQTSAITDMVSNKGIPHFTWILDVLINPHSNNNLRNWVNFKREAGVFVDYLREKDFDKVYIIYANTDAADDEYEGIVRPALVQMGVQDKDIKSESFSLDRTDFADIALKAKQFDPDYVIINGFIPHLVSMVQDFRNLGIIKEGNTIASLDMLDTAPLLTSEDIEGIVVAAPSYLVNRTQEVLVWEDNFRNGYNRNPSYHDAYAYDMVRVILEAAQNMSFPASSKDWIEGVRGVKVKGITGDIEFDGDGSSITPMFPAVYSNGQLVPLK